jgi:hypothetical protein
MIREERNRKRRCQWTLEADGIAGAAKPDRRYQGCNSTYNWVFRVYIVAMISYYNVDILNYSSIISRISPLYSYIVLVVLIVKPWPDPERACGYL